MTTRFQRFLLHSALLSLTVLLLLTSQRAHAHPLQRVLSSPAADVESFLPGIYVPFRAVDLGGYHSCALASSGGVTCWGNNFDGQVGDGTTGDVNGFRTTAMQVVGLTSGVKAIAAGESHTCALTTSGGVKCWGRNIYGQIGDGAMGDANNRLTAVDVVGLTSGVKAIAAGSYHTCALTTSGGAKCWGAAAAGQTGDGTTGDGNGLRLTPVDVVGLTSGVKALSAGLSYTCALTTSGGVKCWGSNSSGQLGDGTTGDSDELRLSPVDVVGLTSDVKAITSGGSYTCALTTAGGVKCWGSNSRGQLGDGTTGDSDNLRLSPVDVVGLTSGVRAIAAGGFHTCALTTSGGVKCWGVAGLGQTGDGTSGDDNDVRLTPVNVVGLPSGIVSISAGNYHTCALIISGGAKCWGYNSDGQTGDGTSGSGNHIRLSPVDVIQP